MKRELVYYGETIKYFIRVILIWTPVLQVIRNGILKYAAGKLVWE